MCLFSEIRFATVFMFRWNVKSKQRKRWNVSWAQTSCRQCLLAWMLEIPKGRKKWGTGKGLLLGLEFLLLEENGKSWPLITLTPSPPVHTLNNHEMVAHLLLFDSLHGRRNRELAVLHSAQTLASLFSEQQFGRQMQFLYKEGCFYKQKQKYKNTFSAPKKLLWVLKKKNGWENVLA